MHRLALPADWKRGLAAPFLFVGLALAAYGSRYGAPATWIAALLCVALAARPLGPGGVALAASPLSLAVGGFAAWLAVSNVAFNASYNPAAQYHAAFLVAGLVLGRRAAGESAALLLRVALVFACGLAAWAAWQRVQGVARPTAAFETPATLATVLNLCLLPAIVCAVSLRSSRWLLGAIALVATGFFLTMSRGGWLALAAGAFIAAAGARRLGLPLLPPRLALVGGILAAGILATWIAPALFGGAPGDPSGRATAPALIPMTGEEAARSSAARLGLYALAFESLSARTLLFGEGYLGFYYLLEAGRAQIPTYEQTITYFAHNDYLQVLLELGVPGIAGLLAMVLAPAVLVWRRGSALEPPARRVCVAALAGLATMAVHAGVDFPFYIPVCLLFYGVGLGVLDTTLATDARAANAARAPSQPSALRRGFTAAMATLAAWVLIAPLAAQAAAGHAERQWAAGLSQSAAYWFGAARVIEPRDWRYHWYAGEFWRVQADISGRRAAADLADQAYADGFSANPREARNLLGRLVLHRRLGDLLTHPASAATQLAWADEAVRLLPHDPAAQRERERVLDGAAR